jgi:hypothetical protein
MCTILASSNKDNGRTKDNKDADTQKASKEGIQQTLLLARAKGLFVWGGQSEFY